MNALVHCLGTFQWFPFVYHLHFLGQAEKSQSKTDTENFIKNSSIRNGIIISVKISRIMKIRFSLLNVRADALSLDEEGSDFFNNFNNLTIFKWISEISFEFNVYVQFKSGSNVFKSSRNINELSVFM